MKIAERPETKPRWKYGLVYLAYAALSALAFIFIIIHLFYIRFREIGDMHSSDYVRPEDYTEYSITLFYMAGAAFLPSIFLLLRHAPILKFTSVFICGTVHLYLAMYHSIENQIFLILVYLFALFSFLFSLLLLRDLNGEMWIYKYNALSNKVEGCWNGLKSMLRAIERFLSKFI